MTSIPKNMRALVIQEHGKASVVDRPVPTPQPKDVLVKVDYAASNPTDHFHISFLGNPDSISGCDFSGVVVSLGSSSSILKVGDRVCGPIHGGKYKDRGAYAEYLRVEEEMIWKVPEGMSMVDAATYGVGFSTAAMSILYHQGNPLPPAKRSHDDWGGSSSIGLFATQLARLAGFRVIVTCSPHSFDLVISYGAEHAVDYHDPGAAVKEIKKLTGDGVVAGIECMGGRTDIKLAIESFGPEGGLLTLLASLPQGLEKLRPNVKPERILLYTVGGYPFDWMPGEPTQTSKPDDRAWFLDFVKAMPDLITEYGIKPNPVDLRQGLDNVQAGLAELQASLTTKEVLQKADKHAAQAKKVSGKKLVYKIA